MCLFVVLHLISFNTYIYICIYKYILQQETSEKLITKVFEGRCEELSALTENLHGDTFMMYLYKEETRIPRQKLEQDENITSYRSL